MLKFRYSSIKHLLRAILWSRVNADGLLSTRPQFESSENSIFKFLSFFYSCNELIKKTETKIG